MRRSGRPRARSSFKTPADRAKDARDAFVQTLREELDRKGKGQQPQEMRLRFSLLSMISTAEIAKINSQMAVGPHTNLLDRDQARFDALFEHLKSELDSGSGPTIILGSVRGKAHELSVCV